MMAQTGFNQDRAVTIIGGGIGGLSAALSFARSGARVTVLEQAQALTEVGAGLQITPNGAVVLEALGLKGPLDRDSVRAEAVEPRDALSGRVLARFDLMALQGAPYRFMHRAALIDLLATACQNAGVSLRLGVRVTAVDAGGGLTLAHGPQPDVGLTVGADGLHSQLRPALNPALDPALNGVAAPFFTGQVAWRAVITCSAPPVARIWMAPRRHVVTYPLPGGRLNIVAVQEQHAWAPEGWHHPDTPAALQAAFADVCPELSEILGQVTQTRLWGLFRHPVAAQWHGSSSAILGDAAHPTLPFLAQGANLAIEDAWVLAACCDGHADLPTALAGYQARRRPRVVRAIAAANQNAVNYHLSGARRLLAQGGLRVLGLIAPQAFLRRMDWLYGHDVTRG